MESNVGLLRHFKRVIDFDSQIAHGAFNFGMTQQQLHCPQIPGAPVNQRRFGSSY
jgi:hypothetical protein